MTTEEAIVQLEDLLEDRAGRLAFVSGGDADETDIKDVEALVIAIAALRNQRKWIPFESREADRDEKENHPEWDSCRVLCGRLPDDGQQILVNIQHKSSETVQLDEFYIDCGCCYLDSGYEIESEATAWMPLPEPYRGGDAE